MKAEANGERTDEITFQFNFEKNNKDRVTFTTIQWEREKRICIRGKFDIIAIQPYLIMWLQKSFHTDTQIGLPLMYSSQRLRSASWAWGFSELRLWIIISTFFS